MPETTEKREGRPDVRREFGDFFLSLFKDHLSKHESVYVDGLGYFSLRGRQSRQGADPLTGEISALPAVPNALHFERTIGLIPRLKEGMLADMELKHAPFVKINFPRIEELHELIEGSRSADKPFNVIRILTPEGGEMLKIRTGTERRNIRYEDGSLNDYAEEWFRFSAGDALKEMIRGVPPADIEK